MPKASRTPHAILGFLTWEPMSGYAIKKAVAASIDNFWNESYGQIYPILKRLVANGLATRSEGASGGRRHHTYAITELGRRALRHWLTEPVVPSVPRNELLLKLFFGRQGEPQASIDHVERFRDRQHELLATYEAMVRHLRDEHAGHPDLPYWLLTLDYGIRERRALIAWSDEALATLRTLARPDGRRRGKGTPKGRAAKNQDQSTATGGPRQ